MNPRQCSWTTGRGFSLLEVMLALALFVMAGVSLAAALNEIARASAESIDEARVRARMRALLTETTRSPRIETGERTVDGEGGLSYRIQVEPADFTTAEGEELEEVFRVRVAAVRDRRDGGEETVAEADTLRYGPLIRRTQ